MSLHGEIRNAILTSLEIKNNEIVQLNNALRLC